MFLIFFTKPLTILTVRLRRTLKANELVFNDLHQVWQLQCFQDFIQIKTRNSLAAFYTKEEWRRGR